MGKPKKRLSNKAKQELRIKFKADQWSSKRLSKGFKTKLVSVGIAPTIADEVGGDEVRSLWTKKGRDNFVKGAKSYKQKGENYLLKKILLGVGK